MGKPRITTADLAEASAALECSKRTVWNLISRYGASGRLCDLVGRQNPRNSGKSHLHEEVEIIISEVIESFHLSHLQPTAVATVQEIRRRCAERGLRLPSRKAIMSRIKRIPEVEIVASRQGRKTARYRHRPLSGKTPETSYPLERVQIDHTMVDIVVVDEVHLEPLRRPFITIAIDEFSRAILGFYLSLESPSATSVGLCLVHAVLPKDEWAARIGLEFDWPVHGRPTCIYVDNGSDFHSEAVERGCAAWGITLEYRPPGMPHFGGIVERMIGTAMRALRSAPGATGRSIIDRGEHHPEADARMTLGQLEHYIAIFFAGKYHKQLHSHHGLTPITKWKRGIFGPGNKQNVIPAPINDPDRLLIDFLPLTRRRITQRGIVWDNIFYMDDLLRPFIENDRGESFIVRRDPRDVSYIWFLSPKDQRYYQIRSRDITRPSISLWEVSEARKKLKADGRRDYDETAIFRAIEAQRSILTDASASKSAARRARLAQARRAQTSRSSDADAPEKAHMHSPWYVSLADDSDADDVFEIEE